MDKLPNISIRPIDSHCHLFDEKFDEDREEIITQILQKLEGIVVILEEPDYLIRKALIKNPRIKYTAGYHPYFAEKAIIADNLRLIKQLSENKSISAIGEIGLDYYHCKVPKKIQQEAFETQLNLASLLDLPVVIHSRSAEKDTYEILKNFSKIKTYKTILHCYGGNMEYLPKFIDLGCYISFAGNITFPKANELRDCVRLTPLERILVETDAPYLAPQPVRGKRCIPEYVVFTILEMAKIKNVDVEEIVAHTNLNAKKIFGMFNA